MKLSIKAIQANCIFILSVFTLGIKAQNFCGTSTFDQQQAMNSIGDLTHTMVETANPIFIPLQIHNLGNDDGKGLYNVFALYESLCTLNDDFKASNIQFYLESPINNIFKSSWNDHPEYFAGEEMMITNNVQNRVNCYIVSNPAGNCGYFTYNGDGVALSKGCLGKASHTWAHELGHFFSLPHTFFGWENIRYSNGTKISDFQRRVFTGIETVDRINCKNQADNFCDTPPDYISYRWSCNSSGFSSLQMKDIRDSIFAADGSLFMSYSNDQCMSRFSEEQNMAMWRSIQFPRSELQRPDLIPSSKLSGNIDLESPINDSRLLAKNILFKWTPVEGAKFYFLRISRTATFSVVVKNLIVNSTEILIDSLIPNANYFWQVKAVSDFDFCGIQSQDGRFKTESISVATDNFSGDHEIMLIPNPVQAGIPLQFFLDLETETVERVSVRNLSGNLISEFNNPPAINGYYSIPLANSPKGIYFLEVRSSYQNYIKRFIIK